MPRFDSTGAAALDQPVIRAAEFIYADFAGGALRVTTYGADLVLSGTGDPELDGTYSAVSASLITFGETTQKEGGSDTFTITLSGMKTLDAELLADIGDRSKWQGRVVRRWKRMYDENNAPIGAFIPHETGYMMTPEILPSAESQTIVMSCENYLAGLSQASNRTYMSQKYYDAADTSAHASIGAANNATTGPGAGVGGGGGGGSRGFEGGVRQMMQAL